MTYNKSGTTLSHSFWKEDGRVILNVSFFKHQLEKLGMAPRNPRVVRAFHAMRKLGVSGVKVKPVFKRLLKLFDGNWEAIEDESYRILADAIFDSEEEVEKKDGEKSTVREPDNHQSGVYDAASSSSVAVPQSKVA